ncbi:MAG: DNA mismatch repair endonuclease MutL [Clostridia bacterium]|nr:DNA mismatch repair endonuclease MutL [Clostridia bacterium]
MARINVLPKNVAELIAAGEVVERPASVIKELVENSIDAGATAITVEIQRGGVTYMRITDNGCGISRDDVPTAFLRHATSKIKTGDDLNNIGTLGFRGEALAAISSVAHIEMLTCTKDEQLGTRYVISGGVEQDFFETGCPVGTTIIVRDIFFNTPARMKFLKTDVAESNAVALVMDRMALSHPEVSFKFIRDGKQTLTTAGDGKLSSAIYSVLGREYFGGLISAENAQDGVTVTGFVCKPVLCRPNRNGQFFFLNGRLVKSGTACAALEQAYKNSAMVGKFPYCVLNISVPLDTVDVNVHPAKTEVRFTDERRVFNCIYYAVKSALAAGDTRPEMTLDKKPVNRFQNMSVEEFRQTVIKETPKDEKTVPVFEEKPKTNFFLSDTKKMLFDETPERLSMLNSSKKAEREEPALPPPPVVEEKCVEIQDEKPPVKYIGEAFKTYIVAEQGNDIYLIDKHAAHERILFEQIKKSAKTERQMLISSVSVPLQKNEYNAIIENPELLSIAGFEIEDFGIDTVLVTAVPAMLEGADIPSAVREIAESIIKTGTATLERIDDIFHIVACRSAIKAGNLQSAEELSAIAERVLSSDDIMYCPHGRPVAMKLSRREIEKQFGRIQ